MRVAGRLHRGVEGDAVGIVLRAARVEHRRQIGAAAEPGFAGDDEARVHVHRRHVRIMRMRDQRNAGGPEARIVVGARDFLAEFRREFAVHGRAMHADFLEHAAVHHRHHAAAARVAPADAIWRALPGRARQSGQRRAVGESGIRRQRIFQALERRADIVAQRLEPGARLGLVAIEFGMIHRRVNSLAANRYHRGKIPPSAARPRRPPLPPPPPY